MAVGVPPGVPPSQVSGIVLAGGKSRRFGSDKALAQLAGQALIAHVIAALASLTAEIIIVGREHAPASALPIRTAPDVFPDHGSLGGLYSGLEEMGTPYGIAVACDMPLLDPKVLRSLLSRANVDVDVVIPRLEEPEPLHALYHQICREPIRRRLEAGQLKMTGFLNDVRVCWLERAELEVLDPAHSSFFNVNTPDDFAHAERVLQGRRA